MKTPCWTMHEIISATGGELRAEGDCPGFDGVSIDSRNIAADDLFVAVRGATHDGHDFIPEVVEKGVRGIVADRQKIGPLIRSIASKEICWAVVDDTVRALGDLAAFHRRRFDIPVVCITGSNGKTTTKEITAAVLGEKKNTLKTLGNLNNEFGVPLTLFRMNQVHEAAVVELGMNHPGEIRRLSEICGPDLGVITNIGPAHLEGLGTINAVTAAKGELIENIKKPGVVILNGDNAHCLRLAERSQRKVLLYGLSAEADVRALEIENRENAIIFRLQLPEEEIQVRMNAPGRFMVSNALAAATVGYVMGLDARQIKSGIEKFTPVRGRMDIKTSQLGFYIIDDSYNANPASMEAAIITLVSLKGSQKGVLVAGDMMELGAEAGKLHEQIGEFAARSGVDRLFLTGSHAAEIRKGAMRQGMSEADIIVGDKAAIIEALPGCLEKGDWVVVKGSRQAKMETIVDQLEALDTSAA